MIASEIRASARQSLIGKWGKGALIILVFLLIMLGISFVLSLIPLIGQIANIVISAPISYGLMVSFIKLKRDENVSFTGFLKDGFSSFGKVWSVVGHTILKMIIPLILVIVFAFMLLFSGVGAMVSSISLQSSSSASGFAGLSLFATIGYIVSFIILVVKGFLYVLTNFILYDNPNMSGKEIVAESERLMKGNRGKYFWLGLTFIGWAILSVFTFYIGLFWLIPYISVSTVIFYETLSGKGSKEEIVVEPENNNPISE